MVQILPWPRLTLSAKVASLACESLSLNMSVSSPREQRETSEKGKLDPLKQRFDSAILEMNKHWRTCQMCSLGSSGLTENSSRQVMLSLDKTTQVILTGVSINLNYRCKSQIYPTVGHKKTFGFYWCACSYGFIKWPLLNCSQAISKLRKHLPI